MAKKIKSNLDSFKKLLKYKSISEDLVVDIVYNLGYSDACINNWNIEHEKDLEKEKEKENKDKEQIVSEDKVVSDLAKEVKDSKIASDDEFWSLLA